MTIVTNVSDLTAGMRALLLRPAESDLPAELINSDAPNTVRAMVRRGLIRVMYAGAYRLTDDGVRCRGVLERETAPAVVVGTIAGYGWVLHHEHGVGDHTVTTWTRDGHTLVLVWSGDYTVSAAVHDGQPLPLDQLVTTIQAEAEEIPYRRLLLQAAARANAVAPRQCAAELTELLVVLADRKPIDPQWMQCVTRLATALLATPFGRS